MSIEHGSIEVIAGGNNYGVSIDPIFPLTSTVSSMPAQIKSRTGVQVGRKLDPLDDGNQGLVARWEGKTSSGVACEVRVWQTAD